MAPSVLVIGASGSVGQPLVKEFQHQRSRFRRVAILSELSKAHKFSAAHNNGIELVLGSFLDFKCYQGAYIVHLCVSKSKSDHLQRL
jgi:nucleoside-diphosphate-sugar epimerase